MSMGYGSDAPTDSATMRGRAWPCLRQFGVYLENRVGSLHELLRHLEKDDLRVAALSIADAVDYAVARLVLNNYEQALERLKLSDFPYFEGDVIGVELPDSTHPHVDVCHTIMQAEVNIHYMYPLIYRRSRRGAVVLHVDDVDQGMRLLQENGFRVITETDLWEDDEYFG